MSLINDALKKAQRDRSGHSGSSIEPVVQSGPMPPQAYHARPAPGGSGGLGRGLVLGAAIVLALVGGGAAVWLLKPSASTPRPAEVAVAAPAQTTATAPRPTISAPPPAQVTVVPTSAPVTPVATAAPATPAPVPPAAPVSPPEPQPFQLRINLPSSPTPAAPDPVATALVSTPSLPRPTAAPVATAPAPSEGFQIRLNLQDSRILAFLDSARINGIRAAADDAKLLMNNKVFKAGDIVDRGLKLKLTKIEPGTLTFEDGQGQIYVKPF